MTNWRIPFGGAQLSSYGADTSTTTGGTCIVQAAGSAHTKGSYSELVASTPFPVNGVLLNLVNHVGDGTTYLVDLAIGGAGSEVVIVENILFSEFTTLSDRHASVIMLPIHIPQGSRVAIRCQGIYGSAYMSAFAVLSSVGFGGYAPYRKVITLGADTSATKPTNLGDGGNWLAHTKKAYVQLTSALSDNIDALCFVVDPMPNTNVVGDAALVDIAVGAAASEIDIVSNFMMHMAQASRYGIPAFVGPIPVSIPAGTRISARMQNEASRTAASADRGICLYGFVK